MITSGNISLPALVLHDTHSVEGLSCMNVQRYDLAGFQSQSSAPNTANNNVSTPLREDSEAKRLIKDLIPPRSRESGTATMSTQRSLGSMRPARDAAKSEIAIDLTLNRSKPPQMLRDSVSRCCVR